MLISFGVAQTLQLRRTTRERDRADRIAAFMTGMFKVSDPSAARGNSITAREIPAAARTHVRGLNWTRPPPIKIPVSASREASSHAGGRRSQSPLTRFKKVVARISTPPTSSPYGVRNVSGRRELVSLKSGWLPMKTILPRKESGALDKARS